MLLFTFDVPRGETSSAPTKQRHSVFDELRRRQAVLTRVGMLFVWALVPLSIAALLDERRINDINIWVKPLKFFLSMIVYYWTLAWLFGYLPQQAQRTRTGRFVIHAPIWIGALEMLWIIVAAAYGVPSHFNRTALAWQLAYMLAGAGAVVLVLVVLAQGILIARSREVHVESALRLALVLGSVVASVSTLIVAGYLGGHDGHWVGGVRSDAGGLPLLGWSRSAGDLRVAHFWALHASQLIPLAGWLISRSRLTGRCYWVGAVALAYSGFVCFTFVQALQGRPFLAAIG